MSKVYNRLTAKNVKDAKGPAMINDGGGLHLQVTPAGGKSWLFRFRWEGKRPQLGLGSYPSVSLAAARRKSEEARGYLNERPKRHPRDVWNALTAQEADSQTFGQFTESFLADILGSYRNEKHRHQWAQTLRTYAAPIWKQDIASVDTDGVLKCLKPIWGAKHETAKRLRGRIERVLDAAKAQGLRSGENPARWRGHLAAILPAIKVKQEHHASMPHQDVPAFMARLASGGSQAALVLRFLILTGARSSEARGALWSEIDKDAKLWSLPAGRMKAFREHRVPLSEPAMEVLRIMGAARRSEFVFPGQAPGKPLSETSIRSLLLRMDLPLVAVDGADGKKMKPVTQHGFRSSFRDWSGDETSASFETAELSIAHSVGNATVRAYRKGDALEKRRKLMDAWGAHCAGMTGAEVVQLHG